MLQLMLAGFFKPCLHPEPYPKEIKLKAPLTRPMLDTPDRTATSAFSRAASNPSVTR
jgi:hypothetical protein